MGAMSSNPSQYIGVTPVYYNRPISSVSISNDSMRIHLVVPGIKRINQVESGVRGDSIVHWHTQFTISANLMSASGAANYTTEAAYAHSSGATKYGMFAVLVAMPVREIGGSDGAISEFAD